MKLAGQPCSCCEHRAQRYGGRIRVLENVNGAVVCLDCDSVYLWPSLTKKKRPR